MMNGLEISKGYFTQIGEPLLQDQFPLQWCRVAAGLVGKGSDCFGFDDVYSQDHDWGPGFSLWLTEKDMNTFGHHLALAYQKLPQHFSGFPVCNSAPRHTGVYSVNRFYELLLGREAIAFLQKGKEIEPAFWLSVSEEQLAATVSGQVFCDPVGEFIRIRQTLQQYYPENLQREKLAAYCQEAGKSGQLVYLRSLSRGEIMAANGALQRFCEAICRIVYIFNRRFCPRYKWLHRGLKQLPILGLEIHPLLQKLCSCAGLPAQETLSAVMDVQADRISQVCQLISDQLTLDDFCHINSTFLVDHSIAILNGCENLTSNR